ncbi:MAG: OmpA family protein [Polyangiaceae bacterium]|nr:OmpA family protein [Polyangiaceae bacterium]
MAVAASILVANVGCTGDVQLKAEVKQPEPPKPPPPAPPPDADGDGVVDDGTDKCVGEKEDGLAPDAKDGCKSNDPDQDGIAGDTDKCPSEAETKNNYQDEDGCPDVPRVLVVNNEVKINDKILFAFGKADIDKQSDDLIKNIAQVIKDNPQIEFLEVAGHADKVGNDAGNVQLTKNRANAVVAALAALGVDKNRMRGAGYGRYCPVDPGDSEEAREKNRRVEFKIMKAGGKETGVPLGCEEAAKKGIKPAGVPATAPSGAKTDAKPAEAKPAEAKPAEAKPAEKAAAPKPADAKPAEAPKK